MPPSGVVLIRPHEERGCCLRKPCSCGFMSSLACCGYLLCRSCSAWDETGRTAPGHQQCQCPRQCLYQFVMSQVDVRCRAGGTVWNGGSKQKMGINCGAAGVVWCPSLFCVDGGYFGRRPHCACWWGFFFFWVTSALEEAGYGALLRRKRYCSEIPTYLRYYT